MSPYKSLLLEFEPRLIRSKEEHARASGILNKLFDEMPETEENAQMAKLFQILIAEYETNLLMRRTPEEVLSHLMKRKEVHQAEVARNAQVPESTISSFLSGKRALSKRDALRLAEYFEVPVGSFLRFDA